MRQPRFFEKGWKKVEAGHYVLHHHKGYIAVVTGRGARRDKFQHAPWYAEVTAPSGETTSKYFWDQRAWNATMRTARAWAFRQMARMESSDTWRGQADRLKWHEIEEILS